MRAVCIIAVSALVSARRRAVEATHADEPIKSAPSFTRRQYPNAGTLDGSSVRTSFRPGDVEAGASAQLKNLRELAICSTGLQDRQAKHQDNNAHALIIGNSLVPAVKALIELNVPLHRTFLINIQLAAMAILRVGWHSSFILSSPYFHAFHYLIVTLVKFVLETQITTTNKFVDAPHQARGDRSIAALALRSAQKTTGLMKVWGIVADGRLAGRSLTKQEKDAAALAVDGKPRIIDDMSAEGEVAAGEAMLRGDLPTVEGPLALAKMTPLLSGLYDAEDEAQEAQLRAALFKSGQIPVLKPLSSFLQLEDAQRAAGSVNSTSTAPATSFVASSVPTHPDPEAAKLASEAIKWASAARLTDKPSASPSQADGTSLSMVLTAVPAPSPLPKPKSSSQLAWPRGGAPPVINPLASAQMQQVQAQLKRLQAVTAAVDKVRFLLNKAQNMLSGMESTAAAMKDNLACVRQELEESMLSGVYIPRWVNRLYGLIDFNGQVVWRLWYALFASRGSGFDTAHNLLYACDIYARLLWQGVISAAMGTSTAGAYGSGTWLGGTPPGSAHGWQPLGSVPANLTLPGV